MHFDNTYARELEGFYAPVSPAPAPRPRELYFNIELAAELSEALRAWPLQEREAVFSGNRVPDGAHPIAQAYAGHQFGGFSPQLGDGRALLLGEVIDTNGRRQDIAFKGSGRTPFARGGDGRAAVGPMLREVLISESLHTLGIPTTRALAVVATGEWVRREKTLPGAVLTRVASSHLRVGTFQYFAARGDHERLHRLVAFALNRHPAEGSPASGEDPDPALSLLHGVVQRQAALIAQWMGVGFIHGVMNTDNMSISGQSIDFGPCAFMEAHDPAMVYSSIDHHGRYAYGNQPRIAAWNLARLAEALLPVMQGSEDERLAQARAAMDAFVPAFEEAMARVWCRKLGWSENLQRKSTDLKQASTLAQEWQSLMQAHRVDHTLGWRSLWHVASGREAPLREAFGEDGQGQAKAWVQRWQAAARGGGWTIDLECLRTANPYVIPRNHLVEAALEAASEGGDLQPFEALLRAVCRPWDEDEALQPYGRPADPEVAARHLTFCGT